MPSICNPKCHWQRTSNGPINGFNALFQICVSPFLRFRFVLHATWNIFVLPIRLPVGCFVLFCFVLVWFVLFCFALLCFVLLCFFVLFRFVLLRFVLFLHHAGLTCNKPLALQFHQAWTHFVRFPSQFVFASRFLHQGSNDGMTIARKWANYGQTPF